MRRWAQCHMSVKVSRTMPKISYQPLLVIWGGLWRLLELIYFWALESSWTPTPSSMLLHFLSVPACMPHDILPQAIISIVRRHVVLSWVMSHSLTWELLNGPDANPAGSDGLTCDMFRTPDESNTILQMRMPPPCVHAVFLPTLTGCK